MFTLNYLKSHCPTKKGLYCVESLVSDDDGWTSQQKSQYLCYLKTLKKGLKKPLKTHTLKNICVIKVKPLQNRSST